MKVQQTSTWRIIDAKTSSPEEMFATDYRSQECLLLLYQIIRGTERNKGKVIGGERNKGKVQTEIKLSEWFDKPTKMSKQFEQQYLGKDAKIQRKKTCNAI